jgi:hypothetical protein
MLYFNSSITVKKEAKFYTGYRLYHYCRLLPSEKNGPSGIFSRQYVNINPEFSSIILTEKSG